MPVKARYICWKRAGERGAWGAALGVLGWLGVAPAQEPAPDAPTLPSPSPEPSPSLGEASPRTESLPSVTTEETSASSAGLSTSTSTDDLDAAVTALMQQESDVSAERRSIDFYGFADFSYYQPLQRNTFYAPESFAVGHVNFYVGSDLGDDWHWLSEVRLMYLPHGSYASSERFLVAPERADTSVTDYSEQDRPVRWGGINIERVWVERRFHPLLNLRFGNFLTPYGIWNVDHGASVVIPTYRPYSVGEELFPQRQTGIEAYGTWTEGTTQLGYHLTLSNGRGPIDTYQDLDGNRAVGGRLFWRQDLPIGTLTLGVSGYKGTYTEADKEVRIVDGDLGIYYPIDAQYRELSLAGDLKWEWLGLLLQAEVIVNEVAYSQGHRPLSTTPVPGPAGYVADYQRYGYYALLGYRTPFWGIMPFALLEASWDGVVAATPWNMRGGFNIRTTPSVVIKLEFAHVWVPDAPAIYFKPADRLTAQLVWAF